MKENAQIELFLNSATPRSGNSEEVPTGEYTGGALTVLWPTGTTDGDLVLEQAPVSGYAGDWIEVGRVTYVAGAPKGQADAGPFVGWFSRARWATDHAGGAGAARVFLTLQATK